MEAPVAKVETLMRRISARQAEYEATHAAWVRNRERWTLLEDEADDRRRAECRAESVRLDARCRALNARIKALHSALWAAECEVGSFQFSGGEEEKFSPPGRSAGAESGCLKEPVSFSDQERGVLTLAAGGNRVGMVQSGNGESGNGESGNGESGNGESGKRKEDGRAGA